MSFLHLDELMGQPVYELKQKDKSGPFMDALWEVTRHHFENCMPYRRFCNKRSFDPASEFDLSQIPYLPTALFKDALLLSVPEEEVFREIQSSATSSGRPSKIGLDKQTNRRQSLCFNKAVLDRIGNRRFNFVVMDLPSAMGRNAVVTARSSTIRSLLFCAKDVRTCLGEDGGQLKLDLENLEVLLDKGSETSRDTIIFGFTFILYANVVRPLLKLGKTFKLPGAKILHIGGWKKLESQKVTPQKLVEDCCAVFGVNPEDVIDLYGFTEQGGMMYPTCEEGNRHVPVWGEVLVRDPVTLELLPIGKQGLMQFITPIQTSYPGHSVLTEDLGSIVGIDDCACGRKGKTFRINGRAEHAEVRGCGDIMAEKFSG